jgi:hypothetical protein
MQGHYNNNEEALSSGRGVRIRMEFEVCECIGHVPSSEAGRFVGAGSVIECGKPNRNFHLAKPIGVNISSRVAPLGPLKHALG